MYIDSTKLTNLTFDYKVVDELFGKIIQCNLQLAQLPDAHAKWHPQKGDFFFYLEKRNQYINEVVDILNGLAFKKRFVHMRVHQIDCMDTLKKLQAAIKTIKKAITIASSMEMTAQSA